MMASFKKTAAIPGKFETFTKMLKNSNPVSKFLAKRKLEQHEVNATSNMFKNRGKAEQLANKADIYKKVREGL